MAQVEFIMPKMGESIMEATILKWVKQVGDSVEVDETILEIATDKVDSEVPSPVSGTIAKIMFAENDTVEIGKVIAIIATEGEEVSPEPTPSVADIPVNGHKSSPEPAPSVQTQVAATVDAETAAPVTVATEKQTTTTRFYSPLVKTLPRKKISASPNWSRSMVRASTAE